MWNVLVKQYTSNSCVDQFFNQLSILTYIGFYFDVCMQVNTLFVVRDDNFIHTVERHALSFHDLITYCFLALGNVVQTEYHVLGRKGDWRTILRVKNIV